MPDPKTVEAGTVFGQWTLLETVIGVSNEKRIALFRCSCGKVVPNNFTLVRKGRSTSCGHGRIKHGGCAGLMSVSDVEIGKTFGCWTVISESFKRSGSHKKRVDVRCVCGNESEVAVCDLVRGGTKSCGKCRNYDKLLMTGDELRNRLYGIWVSMKRRCYSEKHKGYRAYGKRGITVCDQWRENFNAFYDWAIWNGYDAHLTLDRKDSDGHYDPENCQWVSRSFNSKYNKRTSKERNVVYSGETV